jgi:hypothetical protein
VTRPETVPEVTAPEVTAPEVTVPEVTAPEVTVPDGTQPDGTSAPGGSIPEPTEEPDGLGDDAALNALAQGCYDGDMQACDDLYDDSVEDEALEAYKTYGDTCAGRQPERTFVYCTVAFPD